MYDPKAYTIIGVPFDPELITIREQVRGCDHPLPSSVNNSVSINFCGQCGKPAFIHTVEYAGGWKEGDNNICGLQIYYFTESDEGIVGVLIGCASESDPMSFTNQINFLTCREKLQKVLEPLGLWKESEFGIYTITAD